MIKKKEEKHENNERWLLTYSDLITLLMIFFVIMYASSNLDSEKYKKLSDSFKYTFGSGNNVLDEGDVAIPDDKSNITIKDEVLPMEKLKEQVDKMIKDNKLSGDITTKIEERGLVVSLVNNVFFDSGKADIKIDMEQKLLELAKVLNGVDNYIRIEGHTDNVPMHNEEFNSNWQLASVRATNVVEYLINNGVNPKKLSAVGYGEYRPIADNNTVEGRGKNRRIDIVILDSSLNKSENQ